MSSSDVDPAMFNLLREKDVVILVSLSGNNEEIIDIAQKIKLQGTDILFITDFHNNKLQE
ncbi:SIS domain-containing protein [Ruoffia tabacinasalis]|uniref:SIS domain-containing protein n=1 Tax=Ruoffia tabacinasalis TaxID=87458 RepID=UPI0030CFE314